ncbi:MAG: hypothetical protein K9J12_12540 [Melioribacteraceae bacterium]|nr:hypothetical protein [Melioribacteraceae bacterium]MCF8265813.1 hypothetical protein [Melioribacteraceae bacterium]MCF8413936.1 hypothetical protein [Melioribacteraceae bacterium]MCF8430526.1 hypothetical protein [Melioribacteraceae bacterium]
MKSSHFYFILILFSFTTIIAQRGIDPKEQLKELNDKLSLTEEQSIKIELIINESVSQISDMRTAANGDRKMMMIKLRILRDETNKKIEVVLTDDQKIKFKELLKERAERRQNNMGQRRNNF